MKTTTQRANAITAEQITYSQALAAHQSARAKADVECFEKGLRESDDMTDEQIESLCNAIGAVHEKHGVTRKFHALQLAEKAMVKARLSDVLSVADLRERAEVSDLYVKAQKSAVYWQRLVKLCAGDVL